MNPTPEPVISPLTSKDLPAQDALIREVWFIGMDALREKIYGRPIGEPWQEKISRSVKEYLATSGVAAIKATLDGKFAGFLSYRIDRENRFGEIGYNAVDPQFRGHGLAKKMLRHALDHLRAEGIENVEVITGEDEGHAAARRLYEGMGFSPLRVMKRYALSLTATDVKPPSHR